MPATEIAATDTAATDFVIKPPEETEVLMDGELAGRARTAVDEIRRDLLALSSEKLHCRLQRRLQPCLGALEPWTALLLAYFSTLDGMQAEDIETLELETLRVLDDAQQNLGALQGLDLYGGCCGVGWALSHLTETADDDLLELDALVERCIQEQGASTKQDLIGGLVGYGVYLLERLPRSTAFSGLHALVDALERQARFIGEGLIVWWKRPEMMHESERVEAGVYNLGLAHGIPGIVGLLARIHRAGIARRQCRDLLAGALPWLLEQRLPVIGQSCLPRRLTKGETPKPSRIAWCYGELGASVPMLAAARELGDADLERQVIDLALHAAQVTGPEAGVIDPSLCHGAAGNGHIFHRLYRATNEPTLREAAIHWFERTLTYRQPGVGIGGFQSCYPGRPERPWNDDASFIMGSTGIGLALLAAVSDQEPSWDRLLLLS